MHTIQIHIACCTLFFCLLLGACTPVAEEPDAPKEQLIANTTKQASDSTETKQDPLPVSESKRQEQYRPQIHYTVKRNWTNDPNGLVYDGSKWHLAYQYNPYGEGFGEMHWGYAVSEDLIHWTERGIMLAPDELGVCFSGCSVLDKRNVSGLGENSILAFYTCAAAYQQIALAYSTDMGETYQRYGDAPVVPSDLSDFRDPKVVWDEAHGKYVMAIARGGYKGVEFQSSTNLLNWEYNGIFHYPGISNYGPWECPDLFPMTVNGVTKWVLLLSIFDGKYGAGGKSSMLYWVGSFDGNMFYADGAPRWLDGGMDCYAGVTFDNAPDDERIMIAWMNAWCYAGDCPVSPWKSSFTFPRRLTLEERDGEYVLCQKPVPQIASLRTNSEQVVDAWMIEMTVSATENTEIVLSNRFGEEYGITVDVQNGRLVAHREAKSGAYLFNSNFAIPTLYQPLSGIEGVGYKGATVDLTLIIDQSSVEAFANGGACAITNTVYPTTIYSDVTVSPAPVSIEKHALETIWK